MRQPPKYNHGTKVPQTSRTSESSTGKDEGKRSHSREASRTKIAAQETNATCRPCEEGGEQEDGHAQNTTGEIAEGRPPSGSPEGGASNSQRGDSSDSANPDSRACPGPDSCSCSDARTCPCSYPTRVIDGARSVEGSLRYYFSKIREGGN
jgi:hypothetical protein